MAIGAPADAGSANPPEKEHRARFSALKHRDFALLWSGLLVSNTGTWMQTVAQGWLIITLTNSPGWLGAVSIARALPYLVVPPMGGVLADRIDRIALLKVTQTLSLILAGLLAVLTIAHVITVWELMLLAFLSAAANSVDQPTRNALLPDLVPEKDLMNAISLNSITFQGAALVGPAIAGVLVAVIGFGGVFLINAFSFLAVLWALFLMRAASQHQRQETSLRQELGAGVSFVVRTPLVLSLLFLTGVFSIFGRSYTTLMPAFAKGVLHLHSSGLGIMYSAPGLGTLIGGFILASAGDVRRKGTLLLGGAISVAGLLIGFALSPALLPALLLLAGIGAMTTVYSATSTTLLQINAPGPMRGRVMSYNTVALLGLAPLGGGISGFIAEVIGVRESLLLGAVIVAVVTVAFYWLTPHIRAQNRAAPAPMPASPAAR